MAGSARERMEANAASFSTKSLWPARKRSRKFNRLFDARVPNQVKSSLPICVQKPLAALCRAPVSSTEIQDDLANPARSTSCALFRVTAQVGRLNQVCGPACTENRRQIPSNSTTSLIREAYLGTLRAYPSRWMQPKHMVDFASFP